MEFNVNGRHLDRCVGTNVTAVNQNVIIDMVVKEMVRPLFSSVNIIKSPQGNVFLVESKHFIYLLFVCLFVLGLVLT